LALGAGIANRAARRGATRRTRHEACVGGRMQKTTWTVPQFEEINLGSEIGTYYEDEDEPSFVVRRPQRAPYALERQMQRRGDVLRGV
jgi:hypothetical protein